MDRTIERKPWYQRKKNWYMALGVLGIVFLYSVFLGNSGSTLKIKKEKLSIAEVKMDFFQEYIARTGTVNPITTVYLDAIEGGRVEEILLEEGNMVQKGDVILRLSNSELNLQILNSEAAFTEQVNRLRDTKLSMEQDRLNIKRSLLDIDLNLSKSKREYNRNRIFYDKDLISREEFESSKDNFSYYTKTRELLLERQKTDSLSRRIQIQNLENNLKNMEKNLILVRAKLQNLNVKAPVSGQLGTLNAELGESKSRGQRLGQINVLSNFKVNALVDELYITRLTKGLNASFHFNNHDYDLLVSKVYPDVRNGQFEIDLKFKGERPVGIRTGQTFRTKIELGEPREAMVIPRGGFFQSTGGQWVFVLDPSGDFAVKRSIKLGNQNPKYYEILDGLKTGEKVLTNSYESFDKFDKLILK
ncbi:efflux RND transporter periplasmic adaptor subunit [Ancylomarina longa]|uniref:HlyD family efflux transporter periplasmic adaptor subunit n=1 Tax=Ancylomarina longa TaxID=2487017 RepID=A0A434AGW1_9BACT|nr:HlyD family efflux transporter periplasmic adaptor subunit [Ancylomarina longa]RUT73569.1 HlyD family efflux transporter periplasmic adaptor subunit [Ancylomarina longa]